MNYGLYLSASGAITSMYRQDVLANNLANANTIGFKPDAVEFQTRLPERLESGVAADPQELLEQLGGGQHSQPSRISLKQGDLTSTSSDLDVAIQGNGFLVVNDGKGTGTDHIRLTRDGRLSLNADGELVMSASGMRVLDVNDRPIQLQPGQTVTISGNGDVQQAGTSVATLQIADVSNPQALVKQGGNVMKFSSDAKRIPATGTLRQRHLESSGVDPILTLNSMINASKALAANATMMQYHDNILGQAINTFGRVA